jgi:hypothetical protein
MPKAPKPADQDAEDLPAENLTPAVLGIPESCDLFSFDYDQLASIVEGHPDPHIVEVRLCRPSANGKPGSRLMRRGVGRWPIEQATMRWLLDLVGPGVWWVQGYNAGGMLVAAARVEAEDDGDQATSQPTYSGPMPPPVATPAPAPAPSGPDWWHRPPPWVDALLARLTQPPARERDSTLADAIDAMGKIIALDMSREKLKLERARDGENGTSAQSTALNAIVEIAKEKIKAAAPAPTAAPVAQPAAGSAEALALLRFGMKIGAGAPNPGSLEDETKWLDIVPQVIDSLGPGLIALAAGALPKEQGRQVLDMLEKHMRAREAEAKADAKAGSRASNGTPGAAGGGTPFETTGIGVD